MTDRQRRAMFQALSRAGAAKAFLRTFRTHFATSPRDAAASLKRSTERIGWTLKPHGRTTVVRPGRAFTKSDMAAASSGFVPTKNVKVQYKDPGVRRSATLLRSRRISETGPAGLVLGMQARAIYRALARLAAS